MAAAGPPFNIAAPGRPRSTPSPAATRPRFQGDHYTPTTMRGAGTSGSRGMRHARLARRCELSLGDQVRRSSGNVNFGTPTMPPPGTPPQLVGTIAQLAGPAVNSPALQTGGVSSDITLPAIANLSFVYKINPQWESDGATSSTRAGRRIPRSDVHAHDAERFSLSTYRELKDVVEVCRRAPITRSDDQWKAAVRRRVRPVAGHERPDGAAAGLRPLVARGRRRVQVDAELEVRRRLRLHLRRQLD